MNKVVSHILVGLVSAGAAFGVAWTLQKRKYDRLIDEEVASVKEKYASFRKDGVFATVEGAAAELLPGGLAAALEADDGENREQLDALLTEQGYIPVREGDTVSVSIVDGFQTEATAVADGDGGLRLTAVDEAAPEVINLPVSTPTLGVPPTPVVQNMWESVVNNVAPDPTGQSETEDVPEPAEDAEEAPEPLLIMPTPNKDHAFAITYDEFMDDSVHMDNKTSLMFYEGDETLTDEQGNVIRNVEELVGENNLHKFGLGSKDKNALYVRNLKLQLDFEIIRDTRTYTEGHLGIQPENDRRPLKMRADDQ